MRTSDELAAILSATGLSPSDQQETMRRFPEAEEVIRYGFDCDFHAVVFFKGDTPFLMKKW